MSKLKRVHIFLPESIISKLRDIACHEGYANISELIREILRDWMKEREGK